MLGASTAGYTAPTAAPGSLHVWMGVLREAGLCYVRTRGHCVHCLWQCVQCG